MALLVLIKIALIHHGWLVSGCPSLFLRVEGRSEADEWLSWPTVDVGTPVSLWHGGVWCRDGCNGSNLREASPSWLHYSQFNPTSRFKVNQSPGVCFLCVEISWLDDKPWLWIWIWVPLQGPREPTAALYLQLHFAAVIWRARLSLSLWFHM